MHPPQPTPDVNRFDTVAIPVAALPEAGVSGRLRQAFVECGITLVPERLPFAPDGSLQTFESVWLVGLVSAFAWEARGARMRELAGGAADPEVARLLSAFCTKADARFASS